MDKHLQLYLEFLRTNLGHIENKVVFETSLPNEKREIVIIELKNEIRNLRTKCEIKEVENRMLREVVEDRGRFITEMARKPVQMIQSSKQTILTTVSFPEVLPKLQDLLSEISELKDAYEKIAYLPASATPEDVQSTGVLPKVRQFIKKAGETNNSIDTAQQLAKHYNSIAKWCGLPSVPEPLLGKHGKQK